MRIFFLNLLASFIHCNVYRIIASIAFTTILFFMLFPPLTIAYANPMEPAYTQPLPYPIIPLVLKDFYTEENSQFDPQKEKESPLNQVIFHGPRNKKQVALTFDAEMTRGMRANLLTRRVKSSYDKKIIDILNQTQTKATLFLTGMWMELYPEEVKAFAKNSLLELASHSYADTSFEGFCYGLTQISDDQGVHDIEVTQKLLQDATGVTNVYFRFPGGCYSQKDLDIVSKEGLTVVHWDVSGVDGFNYNVNTIERAVIDRVQNGSIIILHMNGAPTAPKTADALPIIIATLKARGYAFVKVSELLAKPIVAIRRQPTSIIQDFIVFENLASKNKN